MIILGGFRDYKQSHFPSYVSSLMASSGPLIQPTPITENYPPPFTDTYDSVDTYEEQTAVFYPSSDFDTYQEADYEDGYGNWLSNCDSEYADSWNDGFFSYSCNEDFDGSANQTSFDYNGSNDSCYDYTEDEVEARPPYIYGLDEIKLCEGFFGYWPCMYRELRQASQPTNYL